MRYGIAEMPLKIEAPVSPTDDTHDGLGLRGKADASFGIGFEQGSEIAFVEVFFSRELKYFGDFFEFEIHLLEEHIPGDPGIMMLREEADRIEVRLKLPRT